MLTIKRLIRVTTGMTLTSFEMSAMGRNRTLAR